jgi:hypothetical protein
VGLAPVAGKAPNKSCAPRSHPDPPRTEGSPPRAMRGLLGLVVRPQRKLRLGVPCAGVGVSRALREPGTGRGRGGDGRRRRKGAEEGQRGRRPALAEERRRMGDWAREKGEQTRNRRRPGWERSGAVPGSSQLFPRRAGDPDSEQRRLPRPRAPRSGPPLATKARRAPHPPPDLPLVRTYDLPAPRPQAPRAP